MAKLTVLMIPSDHPGWVALRATLVEIPEVRLVEELSFGASALAAVRGQPDIIITAEAVEAQESYVFLAALRERCPHARIVVMASRFDVSDLAHVAELNLAGYLLWTDVDSCRVLASSLTSLLAGGLVVHSPIVALALVGGGHHGARSVHDGTGGGIAAAVKHATVIYRLTQREAEVLALLAKGQTNRQIARELGTSVTTTSTQVGGVLQKLNVRSRSEAVGRLLCDRGA